MTKFLLKCFIITTVLLFGVIFGIHLASNNMVEMTGDSRYSTANWIGSGEQMTENDKNDKKQLTSHDLEEKQKKLEQIETFNLFSQIGAKMSNVFQQLFSNLLIKLTESVGNMIT